VVSERQMALDGLSDCWSFLPGSRSRVKFFKFAFPKPGREVEYQSTTDILMAVKRSGFETVMQNILRGRKEWCWLWMEMILPISPLFSHLLPVAPTAPNHFLLLLLSLPYL
jgi:hypothetical protein